MATPKTTSQEKTGGTIQDEDLFRYSQKLPDGSFESRKHDFATLKSAMGIVQNIYNEVPTLDVTRTIATLANNYVSGTVQLYIELFRMIPGDDFTESGPGQITLTLALS